MPQRGRCRNGRVASVRRPPRRTAPSVTEQSRRLPSPHCSLRTDGVTRRDNGRAAAVHATGQSRRRPLRLPRSRTSSTLAAALARPRSFCFRSKEAASGPLPRSGHSTDDQPAADERLFADKATLSFDRRSTPVGSRGSATAFSLARDRSVSRTRDNISRRLSVRRRSPTAPMNLTCCAASAASTRRDKSGVAQRWPAPR